MHQAPVDCARNRGGLPWHRRWRHDGLAAAWSRCRQATIAAAPAALPRHAPTPAEARMKSDVTFLAADAHEGPGPGNQGIEASADYIAERIQEGRAQDRSGGGRLFPAVHDRRAVPLSGDDQELAFHGPDGKVSRPSLKADFTPLAIGSAGTLEKVPVVFAGYGITAKDSRPPGLDYDDYAGIDVKGKAVLDPAPRAAAAR